MRVRTMAVALGMLLAGVTRAQEMTGVGLAYVPDPSAGDVTEVALPRLLAPGDRLEGRYVRVHSDRLQPDGQATPAAGEPGDFRYHPLTGYLPECLYDLAGCDIFDTVNVYYHVDHVAQTFWRDYLGVDIDFRADVFVHISGDGAFADPDRWLIKLGVGKLFMKNAALEDEIIYHEYAHLVHAALGFRIDTDSPMEARALDEGYADYFATSFTDDPRYGEWVITCPPRLHCTGPPDDREVRTLATDPAVWNWNHGAPSTSLKYGVCTRFFELDTKCKTSYLNFSPPHTWGIIWGSALWDLRERLGAEVTDRLAVESLRRLDGRTATMSRAAGALAEADVALFGGRHVEVIQEVMAARGIPPESAVSRTPTGAPSQDDLEIVSVYPNPAQGAVVVQVHLGTPARVRGGLYDMLGRVVARLPAATLPAGRHDLRLTPPEPAAGVYVFWIEAGGQMRTARLVWRP
ncbi:MAG: hypothetical protein KatS3mg042_0529 [Rhodothermaceae bacterium]|nr:MAG: hypothetical protein KatS3mg042_0529 [Rhodothermaceae bacterium]